ncbi:MAG: hypothetical protein Q7R39_07905 [Dehalococcoidia bacterium]|nr:hypothetical protein [Dehalococcoidia bacterium]
MAVAATLTAGELEVNMVDDDPSDNKILACAVEGKVDYIVASDEHLTKLGAFSGIPIVQPLQWALAS